MQVGVLVPAGYRGELATMEPGAAWQRALAVARQADDLGFESLWVFDHLYPVSGPHTGQVLEAFTTLSALAAATSRIRLGHLVLCAAYRNAGLTAKMAGTLDTISGGRFELGIGAGWKEDEWRAFGYGYPPIAERLRILREHIELIGRLLEGHPVTFAGEHAQADDALCDPPGIQRPRIPIMLGGKGPNVTFRIAARFADELNLSQLTPAQTSELLPVIRERCEEIGRDPRTLRVSVYIPDDLIRPTGQERVDLLGEMAALGLSRVMAFPARWGQDPDLQASFAEDCRSAGLLS